MGFARGQSYPVPGQEPGNVDVIGAGEADENVAGGIAFAEFYVAGDHGVYAEAFGKGALRQAGSGAYFGKACGDRAFSLRHHIRPLTYKHFAYTLILSALPRYVQSFRAEKGMYMAEETGFPSPARGYEAATIDLNALLVHNAPATFYMRMRGSQLMYRGIFPEDLLVVDRSKPPVPGCIVVVRQDDEFVCRELVRDGDRFVFSDGTGNLSPVTEDTELFGTVTGVVRKL